MGGAWSRSGSLVHFIEVPSPDFLDELTKADTRAQTRRQTQLSIFYCSAQNRKYFPSHNKSNSGLQTFVLSYDFTL